MTASLGGKFTIWRAESFNMDTITTRLAVEYVSGVHDGCYSETKWRVKSLVRLTDDQVISAVKMAALGCGRFVRIDDRSEVLVDAWHHYQVVNGTTICDSGD